MRVLLAEGDVALRDETTAMLHAAGHDVTALGDGEEALAAHERDRHAIVIIGGGLTGIDGFELCRRIRATEDGVTGAFVIAMTSDRPVNHIMSALQAGADDFIVPVATREGFGERLDACVLIAERRIAEDDHRRRMEDALAQAQRLAGIGEMSMALQHEINNPLAALLGHAALIEQGMHEPGEERELLAVIVEQAHRIANVVKRISALRYPTSVEFVRGGVHMLDLSPPTSPSDRESD